MNNISVSNPVEIATEDGTTKEWGRIIACRSYTIEGITVKDLKEFLKYLMPYVDRVSFCFTNRTDFYGLDDESDDVEGYEAFCSYYSEKDWTWFDMSCSTKPGKFSVYNISFDVKQDSMTVKAYCRSREGLIEFETALQASVCAFIATTGDTKQETAEPEKEPIIREEENRQSFIHQMAPFLDAHGTDKTNVPDLLDYAVKKVRFGFAGLGVRWTAEKDRISFRGHWSAGFHEGGVEGCCHWSLTYVAENAEYHAVQNEKLDDMSYYKTGTHLPPVNDLFYVCNPFGLRGVFEVKCHAFECKRVNDPYFNEGAFLDAYIRYSGKAIVDCTNFAAMSPEDPLGYMCGGDVALFSDGTLQIRPDSPEDNEVEQFSVRSIVHADNNINNYDPEYRNTVSIMTKEKCFQFTFLTTDDKKKFWDALTDA